MRPLSILLLAALTLTPSPARAIKICVDPGHGGSDTGATGCGLTESAINLEIALELADLLQKVNIQALMTRTTDKYIPLAARTAYANANGADRFVSLHCNSATQVFSGIETYCVSGATPTYTSFQLAGAIQSKMLAAWPLPDRGVKTAGFYVLAHTSMPATLSEMGFINNCPVDATYQSSAAQRLEAAKAHLFALQKHLGLPVVDPKPVTGTVKGVIFEDTGKGTADTSIRLPGATVSVVGASLSAVAAPPDASWSFDLPGGSYTLSAAQPGYQGAQLSCTAVVGQTVWCSIGLKPTAPVVDSGVGADLAPPADSAAPSEGGSDGGLQVVSPDRGPLQVVWPDAGVDQSPTVPDLPPAIGGDSAVTGQAEESGCSVGGAPTGPPLPLLLLLGLAVLLRRSRRVTALLALLCFVPTGCDEAAPAPAPRTASPLEAARPVQPFAHLEADRRVASGIAPVLAPDGARVAFTRPGDNRLLIQELDDPAQPPRVVSSRTGAGYRPLWRADSAAIGLRPAGEPHGPGALEALDRDGRRVASFRPRVPSAMQKDDCIYLLLSPRRSRVVACGGDRFFAPELSGDGRHLVYSGIASGLFLYRPGDGKTVALGPGHQPALSADGRLLVFMRGRDDGERLTEADLWITDLSDPGYPTAPLTHTPGRLEQHPSLSADGHLLAYSAGGSIHVARLAFVQRDRR